MDTRLQEQHNVLVVDINQRFVDAANRSNQLEEMINQEREERLRQTDEQLRPIRAKLIGKQYEIYIED